MTKDDIIARLRCQPVEFEGLRLKPWTAATLAAFVDWRRANKGLGGLCERLFALSAVDDQNRPLFDPDADAAVLAELPGALLMRVAGRVSELNGLGDDDPKAGSTEGRN